MAVTYTEIKKVLNKNSLKLLNCLDEYDRLTYKELKEQLKFTQNTLDKELARLEGACCITREKDTTDYRKTYFSITDHGLKLYNN